MMLRTAALAAFVAMGAFVPAASGQAPYPAKQERVEDFAALVPKGPISNVAAPARTLERVTTAVPWARGMAFVDGQMIVLSRGRHRGEGGVSAELVDHAGTLWRVDRSVCEAVIPGEHAGPAVRSNATVFAEPTSPPFALYRHDRPAADDILMDRPYCTLVYDHASRNLFICAYSGAELASGFRKHATDAVHRYDLRDRSWHVVERHHPGAAVVPREALEAVISNVYYPHHDPATNPPPHGWANGADGCVAVGRFLYVAAKDNHLVVQYDLEAIRRDPAAPSPPSRPVLGDRLIIGLPGGGGGGERSMEVLGPSAVAHHGDHLYIGYRTSSVVVRMPVDDEGDIVRRPDGQVAADLIAVFEPWDSRTRRSGNLYDIAISPSGELFVSMGTEGRVWRLTPDPAHPFYGNDQTARQTSAPPFLDMSALAGRKTGCNNIAVGDDGYLYVSTRNNDNGEGEMHGTIYRARIGDGVITDRSTAE